MDFASLRHCQAAANVIALATDASGFNANDFVSTAMLSSHSVSEHINPYASAIVCGKIATRTR